MYDNNLKFCREELEMTQKELGYVFGISNYTIHGWENGHDSIPFNKLLKFCNMYNFSLDFVIGLTRKNIKYGNFKTNKVKIGRKLKELRTSLGLSQQKLSDECNIAQTTYSKYETGTYLINTITLYSICKKYNISMDWICERTNNKYIDKKQYQTN